MSGQSILEQVGLASLMTRRQQCKRTGFLWSSCTNLVSSDNPEPLPWLWSEDGGRWSLFTLCGALGVEAPEKSEWEFCRSYQWRAVTCLVGNDSPKPRRVIQFLYPFWSILGQGRPLTSQGSQTSDCIVCALCGGGAGQRQES